MFEEFYQLTANPFRLAPDPDFCFSHSGYQSAREYLEYALEQGEGFVMVTGRPGTGKTLLVETFLREINTDKVVAKRIAVSNYGADELLRAVAYAYEIDVTEPDKATLRHRIQAYFLQQEQAGRRVLLIMDEAQALQHSALEELRTLADLQTQSRTMLQLFLIGQESLQVLMSAPEMEQFQQRVIANYHLIPLTLQETRSYIEHRLLHAGWSGDPEFTSAAVLSVYQLSKGVPRHINKICNRLLLLGFGKGSYIFDQEDVQAISSEMHDEQLTPMEPDQALLSDADRINSIPEIRDGSISLADLAIRVDKVDAAAFAFSEASRLAAMKKKQFTDRHRDDPATWYPQIPASDDTEKEPAVVPAEPLSTSSTPESVNHQHNSVIAERLRDRIERRRGTMVLAAAMLVVTTVSIVALPSFFNRSPGDSLSPDGKQSRGIEGAIANRQPASLAESALADIQVPVTDEYNLLADHRVPTARETNADADYQPAAGTINRNYFPQEKYSLAVAGATSVRAASVSEGVALTDTLQTSEIPSLLSLGRQSLTEYRLLTPEGNNAYDYFRAVLRLDPANEAAHAGVKEIVDLYITLAKKAVSQQDRDSASRYVERGLSIQSGNRELLALQDRIESSKGNALVVERGVPVSKGTLSAMEQASREDIISRITTFFQKRKDNTNRSETAIPAGWDG
jgi:type II secretory pathway predicted ATPase ExeA